MFQQIFSVQPGPIVMLMAAIGLLAGLYTASNGFKKRLAILPAIQAFTELAIRYYQTKPAEKFFAALLSLVTGNPLPTVGAIAISVIAFILTYLLIGIVFIYLGIPKGKRLGAFSDYLDGGIKNIDARHNQLVQRISDLERNSIQAFAVLKAINETLDDFEKLPQKGVQDMSQKITLMLDSALGKTFGRHQQIRGAIYLLENNTGGAQPTHLRHFCSVNLHNLKTPDHQHDKWPISGSIAGKCFERGDVIIYPKMKEFKKAFVKPKNGSFAKSFICIPIRYDFRKWGVLSIDSNQKDFPAVDDIELSFLSLFAYHLGYAISKSQLTDFTSETIRGRG